MTKTRIIRLIILGGSLFALFGCSGPRIIYSKPGLTSAEFNRDKYACVQQSRTSYSAGGTGAAGGMMIIAAQADADNRSQQLFRMCMEARGYTAQVETEATEVTDEEKDRQKKYTTLATALNTALAERCKDSKYEIFFKKSACKVEELTFIQLADKSYASEEEKESLIKWQTNEKAITDNRREALELASNPRFKKLILLTIEMDIKNEKNALDLYEGKICWGDYNKKRKDNSQVYMDEAKRL